MGFKQWTWRMARLFDVSLATIHRRLKDFNAYVSVSHSFSNIDNNQLDNTILDIKQQHPNSGYRMVLCHLRSRGSFIQHTRVRESMRRVDPKGTVMRWLHVTERREYNVISPNELWSACQTHNPAVPSLSPALTTPQVQIVGHTCK